MSAISHFHKVTPRFFSFSPTARNIIPDGKPPNPASGHAEPPTQAAVPITEQEYHIVADLWIDETLDKLEALQDERPDVDVEYAVR